ncbi:hypothetical protein LTR36_000462 [Oleoguttula mirabilis]|uniref:Uncharacterized protein n=1 Tax=Oleoguttula mirabilis TaxID=1507867 RepID=A0AAV9K0M8_9PEZI|nr:hypothetical protein LTR36_000462 [Oleoguttula mirabilis]
MQSNNGMSGANNFNNTGRGQGWSNRDFDNMTPMPGAGGVSGFNNPRYVPPQMRSVFERPVRPESSMSNTSFATQAYVMDGGVSLRGFTDVPRPQMSGGRYGGYGGLGQGMSGDMGGHGGLGAMGGMGGGGYGPPPGNYAFGQQAPYANQPTSFLDNNPAGMRPGYGRPSASGTIAQAPATPSTIFRRDSASAVDTAAAPNAALIAHAIRCGNYDVDDFETGPPGCYGYDRKNGRASMSVTGPQHRTTRSTADALLQPANPVNALVSHREGNTKGSAAAFIAVEVVTPPEWFPRLSMGFKPTMEMLFQVIPVIEPCRFAVASTAGVVRVNNIPYNTPRSEITAFVGRNAQIVSQPEGSPYHAVHIIMERHTGKTMDAFIEFSRASEATWVVNQFQKRIVQGRHPRVGDRQVEVVLSSQEELMSELFPRAKHVRWEGATPRVLVNTQMYYEDVDSAGFTGFLQNEEIVMAVKHAETPHRSPFAQRCILRVYESHISTLHKYPWFAHENVNMTERRLLFDATLAIMRCLIAFLRRVGPQQLDNTKPTAATLQELAVAALTCPGFSEQQKAALVLCMQQGGYNGMTSSRGMNITFGGNTLIAQHWPFKVLARDPKASDQMVGYFADLIHGATASSEALSLADEHAMRASGGSAQGPFGDITFEYGDATTIAEVGKIELRTIEALLGRILPRSRSTDSNSS